jgi:hypothetical protein
MIGGLKETTILYIFPAHPPFNESGLKGHLLLPGSRAVYVVPIPPPE